MAVEAPLSICLEIWAHKPTRVKCSSRHRSLATGGTLAEFCTKARTVCREIVEGPVLTTTLLELPQLLIRIEKEVQQITDKEVADKFSV